MSTMFPGSNTPGLRGYQKPNPFQFGGQTFDRNDLPRGPGLRGYQQQNQPWMMQNSSVAGQEVPPNSSGNHNIAARSFSMSPSSAGLQPIYNASQRAGFANQGLRTPPQHGAFLTSHQKGLLAYRGMGNGYDPRFKQDPPGARLTAPQPNFDAQGNRSFGGNGFPEFKAGQDYRAYPVDQQKQHPDEPIPYADRVVHVSNSPVTGGLKLVGEGLTPRPSLEQLDKRESALQRYAQQKQELHDNRVMLAKQMFGLSDDVPAVARAMANRAMSPLAQYQAGLQQHQAETASVQKHNDAVRQQALTTLMDPANKLGLKELKARMEAMMLPLPTRPTLKDYQASLKGRSPLKEYAATQKRKAQAPKVEPKKYPDGVQGLVEAGSDLINEFTPASVGVNPTPNRPLMTGH